MTEPTQIKKLPPVIGFTGPSQNGKSAAATWILRNHHICSRMSFAEPIKRMTREFLRSILPKDWPIDSSSYVSDIGHKNEPIPFLGGMTARHLMQTLGTEWGRETLHPDFWVGIAATKLERKLGSNFVKTDRVPIKVVFDDVRFANEAEMIRMHGGMIVRILRPDHTPDAKVADHASEAFGFDVDLTVMNDGTLEDLHAKISALSPVQPLPPKKPRSN